MWGRGLGRRIEFKKTEGRRLRGEHAVICQSFQDYPNNPRTFIEQSVASKITWKNSLELEKMLGNLQNKIIQALQSQLNNFFSVYESIATHIFVNFVRPHICWRVSVDVAFYLKWHFGRQRRGFESGSWFESTSWFLGEVGLSPHLCFLGWGEFLKKKISFGGGWVVVMVLL